jgi:hypothetical protein
MKIQKVIPIGIIIKLCLVKIAIAGVWGTNNFLYKPSYGESGTTSYNNFTTGLTRVDTRLGKEIWVGDPNYGTTLQDAINAIGPSQATLHLPRGTHNITSNLTIPAHINLKPESGSLLSIASGVTLTINGPFSAGLFPVFTGNGAVRFGSKSVSAICPEWSAAATDSGKVQWAVNASLWEVATAQQFPVASGSIPLIINRLYTLTDPVNIDIAVGHAYQEFRIIGSGLNAGFYTANAINMFSSTIPHTNAPVSEHITFENIHFEASTNDLNAFVLDGNKFLRMKFHNCFFLKIRCAYSATFLQSYKFILCNIRQVKGVFIEVTTGGLVNGLVSDFHWTDNVMESPTVTPSAFLKTVGTVTGASFKGGLFEGATSGPFYEADHSFGVSFIGMYFEGLSDNTIKLGVSLSAYIAGNYFNNMAPYDIDCGLSRNIVSQGNYSASPGIYNNSAMADVNQDGLLSQGDYSQSGNIAATFPYKYEEFYAYLYGLTISPYPILVKATRENRQVTIQWPDMSGIPNSTDMYLTGIPARYLPKSNYKSYTTANIIDNAIPQIGKVVVDQNAIRFYKLDGSNLTYGGTKGLVAGSITYMLVRQDFP